MWHLLEQGILDLQHEHRIVLHFPAQLHVHVDTRLAVSFTVWFFWPHGDFKMKNNNKSVVPLLLYYVTTLQFAILCGLQCQTCTDILK